MVHKKGTQPTIMDSIRDQMERIDKQYPVVATRFYVEEVQPPHYYNDEYGGQWSKEIAVKVSPAFETKEEAEAWVDEHEADNGRHLRIMKQHKRRTTYEAWWAAVKVG